MEVGDRHLLEATAGGDGDAFAAFFCRHERAVLGFLVKRCATPDDVADALSETFLAALRSAGRYRAETRDALPWLLGIAVNVVLRQRRGAARRLRLGAKVSATAPRYVGDEADRIAAAIDAARLAGDVEAALERMPRREREVLELVAFAGLSPTEVAEALGVSPNAARLRLSRARKRVREAVPALDPEPTHV